MKPIYSFKEKQKHFNDLRAPQHAPADLELLEQKSPTHSSLSSFKCFPERKHNEMLYALLEVATREEIIANRRNYKSPEEKSAEEAARIAAEKEAKEKAEEAERLAAEKEAKEKAEETARIARLVAEKEAKEKAEGTVPSSEHEELQEENEALQEENEVLQEELEGEKKKEPTKKPAAKKTAAKPKSKSTQK